MTEMENIRAKQEPVEDRRSLPPRIRPEEMVATVPVEEVREDDEVKDPGLPRGWMLA